MGDHTQVSTTADQYLFNFADELYRSHARGKGPEIKNWIAHQLSGPMKSDVATTVRLNQFNPPAGQEIGRGYNVLQARIASQGDDRRVLQQQKRVADSPLFHQPHNRLL